jgi:hypothetical protein
MSKGSGGGGNQSRRATAALVKGVSAGALAATRAVAGILADGISSAVSAAPTRSVAFQSGLFSGANTPAEVNKIATSQSFYKGATGNTPLKITVYHGGKVAITDGHHRLTAAKAVGATRIRADITYMGPKGGTKDVARGKVVKI